MWRRLVLIGLVHFVAFMGALGWSAWRASQVRTELTAAQRIAVQVQAELSSGDLKAARAALPELRRRVDLADQRAGGPVWSVAQQVPLLGSNLRAVRRTAQAARVLGDQALPEATSALDLVRTREPLGSRRIDLVLLADVKAHVDSAAQGSRRARTLLGHRDGFLLDGVRAKVEQARDRVVALDEALQSAARALQLAPRMLGGDGPRRYFVAVQNNAEARATGGLVGAFALVSVDRGSIRLERTGTDSDLKSARTPVPIDPAAAKTWQRFGSTLAWFDVNLTPHFPDAAQAMAGLWHAQSGQRVDGVVAIDLVVMRELLAATGAVHLPDGTSVGAGNVVDFVAHDQYVRYTDHAHRKRLLSALAADLFLRAVAAKDPVPTMRALGRAAGSGHLYVWSAKAAEERLLTRGLTGGALPMTDAPYLSVLTQNFGGNKLDFYLRRQIRVSRQPDGALRVRVRLRNGAPEGLPAYMTVRSDRPEPPVPYGQAKVGLSVYGARRTSVSSVEVDGRPSTMTFDKDHGHNVGTLSLEVPRGRDVVVVVTMTQPAGHLVYRQQPLVVSDLLDLQVPHTVVGR
ncbi:MAG: beta-glucan endohydrolase [Frankiales bacterium]|nr:beta-glucan endohydrolase [Frankiales bacterium]